jgi:hypothetical protein
MIRHILLWKVAEGADEQRLAELLNELPKHIDYVRNWQLGPHAGDPVEGAEWDYALMCDFDSVEQVRAYYADAFHVSLMPEMEPMFGEAAVVDMELPDLAP